MEGYGPAGGVPEREDGHSRMGIASFVIAIVAVVAIVVLFVVAGFLTAQLSQGIDFQNATPQELQQDLQNSPGFIGLALAGIGIFVCLLVSLVGFVLGVAGIVQGRRKRLFAILGSVFNGLVLLVFALLFLLGLLAA